jgi:hypothetical protein
MKKRIVDWVDICIDADFTLEQKIIILKKMLDIN